MSKAPDPHWRYIALRLAGDRAPSRRAMQNALLGRARKEDVSDDNAPQLTRYGWPHAIVKVHHHQLASARQWLPRVDFAVDGDRIGLTVETIGASGTIKALTERIGVLIERGPAGKKDARTKPPARSASGAARPPGNPSRRRP